MQIQRIAPIISVDQEGNIDWQNAALSYDPALFYSGKKVTNEVFNDLFIKQTSHGNYTADTLKQFLTTHLPTAIFRQVQNRFKFTEHYTRLFNSTDWKGPEADGYYYIDIPATEHGIYTTTDENMQATIKVEMYAVDTNGNFYNIEQFDIDNNNGVRLYTDDTSLIGYAIIALSNKAYTVVNQGKIDASQITGLSRVALTGNYSDLNTTPDETIANLIEDTTGIKNGTITAGKASVAESVERILTTTTFAGIPFTNIFELGSSFVKNATHAIRADSATNATNATNATKINQLEIIQDTKGVLKIGSTIVPQKRLLWEGEEYLAASAGGSTYAYFAKKPLGITGDFTYEVHTNKGIVKGNTLQEHILFIVSNPGGGIFNNVGILSVNPTSTPYSGTPNDEYVAIKFLHLDNSGYVGNSNITITKIYQVIE